MNVKELITELEKIENKQLPVYIFIPEPNKIDTEIMSIQMIDCGVSDRIDINI